ncbi:glycosyltransferase [Thermoleptolyngbya sichuanensis A183]|uniref:Glycosyltransferase n=1 Tax=Thermoleptolyngbya sichuanensis A183 TaxID=2737172 RepID=A0A6M8B9A0_9CYAN|nr:MULTISPECIES: glycosyltransferase [Thermoleptolyngbya]QKD83048.1 glycosyltransferase [Thermoleptolyngbya sichuanensis A183]
MQIPSTDLEFSLVCFDLSIYGHHPHYILHLCKGWTARSPLGTLFFVVSPQFLKVHADVVRQCSQGASVQFVAITEAEQTALKSRSSGIARNLRNFQEWRLFARYAQLLQADHALMLYLDTCLLPMAAGLSFPCPVSGIYFRPTFHYYTFSPRPQTWRDRLQAWRDRLILGAALRHPQFRTLFSLDPIAPGHITPPPHVKVCALADPVDLAYQSAGSGVELRQQLEIEGDRTVFLLFGALTARKGIYPLLESLELLPDEVCQQVCLILLGEANAGDQPRIARSVSLLRQCKPIQILERYEFVEDSVLHQYIEIADVVLALYQKHVGMSGILMQAALHQKPVLSSDYGLMGELVRQYELGLAIQSEKPGAIANGITHYILQGQEININLHRTHELIANHTSTKFSTSILSECVSQEIYAKAQHL